MKFQKTAKKYFSMMLITAMVVSLAACGKDVDSNKDSNADKPTGEEQTGDPESKGADASGEIESDSSANSGDGVGQPDPYGAYPETVTMEIGKFFGITVEFPDGRSREDNAIRDYVKEKLNLEYNFTWDIMGGEDYQRQQSLAIVSEELAVTGKDLIEETGMQAGPELGVMLKKLLDFVVEDPSRNEREVLLKAAKEFK